MKYAIITIEWLTSKGIVVPEHARKSIDGTEVVMHLDFIKPVITEQDNIKIYEYDNSEFRDILNSDMWTIKEDIINE